MAPKLGKFGAGVRQRLGVLKAQKVKKTRTSIGQFLIDTWRQADLDAHRVRLGASAAGSSAGDLKPLAKSVGKQRLRRGKLKPDTRNSNREVQRVLRKAACLPEPYVADVPLWDDEADQQVMLPIKVYPPHETLEALVLPGCEEEWSSIDESQEGIRVRLTDWSRRVGVSLLGTLLALCLWGDSAPSTKRDSVYLLTYRVLTGTHRRRVWIAALGKSQLCKCGCFGRHTFDALFAIVSWSMRHLLIGVWPETDHLGRRFSKSDWRSGMAGKPLRFRAGVVAKCGDWAWHKQILGMRGWQERFLCWRCQATLSDRDFSLSAVWRRSRHSMSAFLSGAYSGRQYLSALFSCPGFTLDYIEPDWMHTVCLGVLQYLEGNVMLELWQKVKRRGMTKTHVEAMLMNMITSTARVMGVDRPFAKLVFTMILPSKSKKPRMRLKAAEGRDFLPILTRMLVDYFPAQTEAEQIRLHCCQAMCRCYLEMRRWADGSPRRLETAARQCLMLYVQRSDMEPDGSRKWKVYPKHHLMVHVSTVDTNPMLMWNYGDEDEIGKAAKQAKRCNPKWVSSSLIERYRVICVHE